MKNEKFELALKIAESAFAGKTDKAGEPYINHLKRVSDCFEETHFTTKIIALLHDILEDCPEWNEKSLRCLFSDAVVDSVVALTHKPNQTYYEYITQVLENGCATLVKLRDLEDNMNITRLKELTKEDFERLKKYHEAYHRIVNHIQKNEK